MKKADIGLIGLAVMGENLIMNMESKGFTVACYNRTVEKVDAFVNGRAKGKNIIGCHSIQELADNLEKPRKVFCMVKAGAAVDAMIEQLLGVLEPGDIIIDGGNSHFPDTIRRTQYVESKGLLYVGTGVSGGEEGALKGPSMMPGGSPAAWPYVKPIFQGICAKVEDGSPCCDWVGENGAGHFVKMVHNGIEYGDMQLICESYQLMRDLLGMSDDESTRYSSSGTPRSSTATSSRSRATSSPTRTRTVLRSWRTSSTRPARREPASGRASPPSTRACRSRSSARPCSRVASPR